MTDSLGKEGQVRSGPISDFVPGLDLPQLARTAHRYEAAIANLNGVFPTALSGHLMQVRQRKIAIKAAQTPELETSQRQVAVEKMLATLREIYGDD